MQNRKPRLKVGDLVRIKTKNIGDRSDLFLVEGIRQFEKDIYPDLDSFLYENGKSVEIVWNALLHNFRDGSSYWYDQLNRFEKVSK